MIALFFTCALKPVRICPDVDYPVTLKEPTHSKVQQNSSVSKKYVNLYGEGGLWEGSRKDGLDDRVSLRL